MQNIIQSIKENLTHYYLMAQAVLPYLKKSKKQKQQVAAQRIRVKVPIQINKYPL